MRDSEMPSPGSTARVQLSRVLTRPEADVQSLFGSLSQPSDIADLLEVTWSQLHFVTSRGRGAYGYRSFSIPKKGGGIRTIHAPHPTIRILQRKLLTALNLVYKAHPAAYGFVPRRSILSNAEKHQGARMLLNVDLNDFFPTITFPRVRGVFIKRFKLPSDVATILARLCCNTGDVPDHLPQGGPTSPIMSNMVCHSMDRELVALARSQGAYYTRYADDLTFSTHRRSFSPQIAIMAGARLVAVGSEIKRIVSDHQFELNERKQRAARRTERLSVTGLTVNEFPNIPREYSRSI